MQVNIFECGGLEVIGLPVAVKIVEKDLAIGYIIDLLFIRV